MTQFNLWHKKHMTWNKDQEALQRNFLNTYTHYSWTRQEIYRSMQTHTYILSSLIRCSPIPSPYAQSVWGADALLPSLPPLLLLRGDEWPVRDSRSWPVLSLKSTVSPLCEWFTDQPQSLVQMVQIPAHWGQTGKTSFFILVLLFSKPIVLIQRVIQRW